MDDRDCIDARTVDCVHPCGRSKAEKTMTTHSLRAMMHACHSRRSKSMQQAALLATSQLFRHHCVQMTKGAAEDWISLPIPQTGLQRAAFVDACTNWVTSEPPLPQSGPTSEDARRLAPSTILSSRSPSPPDTDESLFHMLADVRGRRRCCLCSGLENKRTQHVLASPFTQRCYVVVCTTCCPT